MCKCNVSLAFAEIVAHRLGYRTRVTRIDEHVLRVHQNICHYRCNFQIRTGQTFQIVEEMIQFARDHKSRCVVEDFSFG